MNKFSQGAGFGGGFKGNKGGNRFGGGFGGGTRGGFGGGRGGFKPRFNDGEDREMFDANCGECGNDCQVPFRPNGRKPVLCSNCFRKEEGGNDRGSRNFGSDRFGGDRPSFREKRSFGGDRFSRGSESKTTEERLQSIEAKLDVILSQLRRIARENKAESFSENKPEAPALEDLNLE
jgi:CxxC-x17-CxxC domain-containing protein